MAALIAAREPYGAFLVSVSDADFVMVFARSLSTVRLVKNGDVKPCDECQFWIIDGYITHMY